MVKPVLYKSNSPILHSSTHIFSLPMFGCSTYIIIIFYYMDRTNAYAKIIFNYILYSLCTY